VVRLDSDHIRVMPGSGTVGSLRVFEKISLVDNPIENANKAELQKDMQKVRDPLVGKTLAYGMPTHDLALTFLVPGSRAGRLMARWRERRQD
jgi:hypothetical protein